MIETQPRTTSVAVDVDVEAALFDSADMLGHQMLVDMGGKLGYRGARRGFSPRDLLLAALAGCSGASFLAAMRDSGQTLTSCQIVVSGELDPRPPQVFRKIDLLLRVAGPALDEDAVRQASQACHG